MINRDLPSTHTDTKTERDRGGFIAIYLDILTPYFGAMTRQTITLYTLNCPRKMITSVTTSSTVIHLLSATHFRLHKTNLPGEPYSHKFSIERTRDIRNTAL